MDHPNQRKHGPIREQLVPEVGTSIFHLFFLVLILIIRYLIDRLKAARLWPRDVVGWCHALLVTSMVVMVLHIGSVCSSIIDERCDYLYTKGLVDYLQVQGQCSKLNWADLVCAPRGIPYADSEPSSKYWEICLEQLQEPDMKILTAQAIREDPVIKESLAIFYREVCAGIVSYVAFRFVLSR